MTFFSFLYPKQKQMPILLLIQNFSFCFFINVKEYDLRCIIKVSMSDKILNISALTAYTYKIYFLIEISHLFLVFSELSYFIHLSWNMVKTDVLIRIYY